MIGAADRAACGFQLSEGAGVMDWKKIFTVLGDMVAVVAIFVAIWVFLLAAHAIGG